MKTPKMSMLNSRSQNLKRKSPQPEANTDRPQCSPRRRRRKSLQSPEHESSSSSSQGSSPVHFSPSQSPTRSTTLPPPPPPPPPAPGPSKWRCHDCYRVYRLSVTQRCLHCSHRLCRPEQSGDVEQPRCKTLVDLPGWKTYGHWRRYRHLGADGYNISGITSSPSSPSPSDDDMQDFITDEEWNRLRRLQTGGHDCAEDCDWPRQCKFERGMQMMRDQKASANRKNGGKSESDAGTEPGSNGEAEDKDEEQEDSDWDEDDSDMDMDDSGDEEDVYVYMEDSDGKEGHDCETQNDEGDLSSFEDDNNENLDASDSPGY